MTFAAGPILSQIGSPSMVINLVPSFLASVAAPDPVEGYLRFFEENRAILAPVWRNYVLDPEDSAAQPFIRRLAHADRRDLRRLLDGVDVRQLAEDALARCQDLFEVERPVDVYLLVGVGNALSGELVLSGRGTAFVCMEHFTGRANPETFGMGLAPDLLRIPISHNVAHTVRYNSPTSRSQLARLVADAGGNYDYWESGSLATVAEMLINEGLAVAASREAVPGYELRHYLGFGSGHYNRLRRLEAFLRRVASRELRRTGIGYRLRYLHHGVPAASRQVAGKLLPERSGYYLGYRWAEHHVAQRGIAAALRATADECLQSDAARARAH